MKRILWFLTAALLAIPATIASAITIDGVAESDYGSAISTQAIGTTGLNNNISTNSGLANGSELDAAYGFVSNGVLYLTVAGNFDSAFGYAPYDTLHMFFMVDDGGPVNVVPTFADGGFNGRRNNMTGLTFDTGFNPNYWIYVNTGQNDALTNPVTTYADYVVFNSNGPSAFLGNVDPPGTITNIYFGSVVQVSLDNSNTNGVDAYPCDTNQTTLLAQSVAASAVRSGVELAIPLTQLGLFSSATGSIRVCAFITEQNMEYMYNQSLGAFNGGPGYCNDFSGALFAFTAGFDFNGYPGQHYFTIPVPPCNAIKISPASGNYSSTGGVGNVVTVQNSGGCPITVTPSTNWLTITSSSGLGSGNGSFTYSVASNTASIQTRTAQFIIRNTDGSGNIITQTLAVTQTGVPSPALSSTFTIDGIAEAAYGCPLTVQNIQTGFGNNTGTNLISNGGGSELDAAYGIIENGNLFLVFAGNLENNGNKIDIFFMTGPGGQNTLSNANPNVANLNNMATSTNGFTFHTGFAPNYVISANVGGGSFFVDYAQLVQGGTNSGAVGYFLGSTTITNGTLIGGTNPFGIQATINNSNTNGVDGANPGCPTNGSGQVQSEVAALVRTGIELGIPLTALGSPTGAIAIVALINNSGQTFLSNQMLPSLVTNTCQGNLGSGANSTPTINLTNFAGQASFLVGPEMAIKSISTVATNVVISFQTESNSNLLYQVQRASVLTTNTTWSAASALTNGTGGITTLTIINGATNNPAQFYRVREIPLCQ